MTNASFSFSHLEDEFHNNFAESVTKGFVQNNDLLRRIDSYCAQKSNEDVQIQTPIAILGESGSGSSALLANWTRIRQNAANHNEHIFYHVIGCTRLSCDVTILLRRLINWLVKQFFLKDVIDLSDDKLPWILPRLLDRASKKGTAIIVLDGLQYTKGSGLTWLPTKLPSLNVRMIVSSSFSSGDIDVNVKPKQLAKTEQIYEEIQRRQWPVITLNPLSEETICTVVTNQLSMLMDNSYIEVVSHLCSHQMSSNPSFLTTMLRGVSHSNADFDDMKQCSNVAGLIEQMLSRYDSEMQGNRLGNALSLLFISRHGLHYDELFDLLARIMNQSQWKQVAPRSNVSVNLKILRVLVKEKKRLIDIFRSCDRDGNGTLTHDDFYKGVSQLDLSMSRSEVCSLIAVVDDCSSDKIDYEEALVHFERVARSFSVFTPNTTTNMECKVETLSLSEKEKKDIVEKLVYIGVTRLDSGFGQLLTLPANNPILKNVVWDKYIATTSREAELRALFIEYLQTKDPSLRYCEELPWQQQKNQCPNLGRTLVDLRVLDIMFNADELKHELFTYLSNLVLNNNFDVVYEYNRAVEKWNKIVKPTSTKLSLMCMFLANVMHWFSKNFAQISECPPFLRDKLEELDKNLLFGLPDLDALLRPSVSAASVTNQTQTSQLYFYHRWIWVNFPWVLLQLASKSLRKADKKIESKKDVAASEKTVREREINRTTPLPASVKKKIDKIKASDDTKTQHPHISLVDTLEQKERRAKELWNALKIERAKRELRLQVLQDDAALARVALTISNLHQEQGGSILLELKSRIAKVRDLFEQAVSIQSSFTDILGALEACDPANLRRHEELEQQISLSKKQLRDLRKERMKTIEHVKITRVEALGVKAMVKETSDERERVGSLLQSYQSQVKEEEERLKHVRVKSFDPAAFSKRVQLEGKIAKRRQDKIKLLQHQTPWKAPTVEDLVTDHPIVRLAKVSGTTEPQAIATILVQGKKEAENYKNRQELLEMQLREKRVELERLHNQTKQLHLANSVTDACAPNDMKKECTELLCRQNQVEIMTNLTTNVTINLTNLHEKVQSTVTKCQTNVFNESSDKNDAMKVISLVKDLCSDFVQISTSLDMKESERYENIRVLNKSQVEARAIQFPRREALGNSGEGAASERLDELVDFIDRSLSHVALTEKRRVNLLNRSKPGGKAGGKASRGLILDSALG